MRFDALHIQDLLALFYLFFFWLLPCTVYPCTLLHVYCRRREDQSQKTVWLILMCQRFPRTAWARSYIVFLIPAFSTTWCHWFHGAIATFWILRLQVLLFLLLLLRNPRVSESYSWSRPWCQDSLEYDSTSFIANNSLIDAPQWHSILFAQIVIQDLVHVTRLPRTRHSGLSPMTVTVDLVSNDFHLVLPFHVHHFRMDQEAWRRQFDFLPYYPFLLSRVQTLWWTLDWKQNLDERYILSNYTELIHDSSIPVG